MYALQPLPHFRDVSLVAQRNSIGYIFRPSEVTAFKRGWEPALGSTDATGVNGRPGRWLSFGCF
jgi:hypothetical protein